jgi:hypothetical protein
LKTVGLDYETTPVGFFEKSPKARKKINASDHPRLARPIYLALATENDFQIIPSPTSNDFPFADHLILFNAAFDLMVAHTQRETDDLSLLYSQSFDDVLVMLKVLGIS